ncbi:efflux RND transporter periplasmic adaptor subunit [Bdellovibrio bacteriovorus]|uniref:efflux RND transporter periplasmic adaptor subunit n=1 Tax=Bdellovibrio TaxID=958 RepID=UPI0035A83207
MKNLFSKKAFWIVVILIVLVCIPFVLSSSKKSTSSLGTVEKGEIVQRVSLSGVVQPVRKALIVASYSGYVKKMFVKVGQDVKIGDPLVSVVQSLSSFEEAFPLRSPVKGRVVQIRHTEGEFVKSGDTTDFILRVDDLSEMYVYVNAAEIDRVKMTVNQEAMLKPMALSEKSYKAQIVDLALAANDKDRWDRSSVVEFPITLKILNPDADLKSGMSTLIDIITFKKDQVLTLRHEFVYSQGDENYVLLENGEKRVIKIGVSNEEKIEILEGLKEGDKVQKVDFASMLENS